MVSDRGTAWKSSSPEGVERTCQSAPRGEATLTPRSGRRTAAADGPGRSVAPPAGAGAYAEVGGEASLAAIASAASSAERPFFDFSILTRWEISTVRRPVGSSAQANCRRRPFMETTRAAYERGSHLG